MPFLFSQFCFPDLEDERGSPNDRLSESFTFTLTQDEGTRIFGFCRRLVQSGQLPICLCVLSRRPWFSLFMHMLDILQLNYDLAKFVPAFMAAAHGTPLPPQPFGRDKAVVNATMGRDAATMVVGVMFATVLLIATFDILRDEFPAPGGRFAKWCVLAGGVAASGCTGCAENGSSQKCA